MASPELPLVLESGWDRYSKAYAQECSRTYKHSTGTKFLKKIQMVIAELGVHYTNHNEVKEKLTPQTAAYVKEQQNKFDDKHAFRDFVFGLQVWGELAYWLVGLRPLDQFVHFGPRPLANGLRPPNASLSMEIRPILPPGFIEVIHVPST